MDSKDKTRGDRRYNAQKVASKRRERYNDVDTSEGYYRDCNMACGCFLCKPWRHGLEPKYKPSELKKLEDADDE